MIINFKDGTANIPVKKVIKTDYEKIVHCGIHHQPRRVGEYGAVHL